MVRQEKYSASIVCPKCGKIVKADIELKISIEGSPGVAFKSPAFNNGAVIASTATDGRLYCEDCSAKMFQCDPKIANLVARFNTAGFRTQYSCEGHVTPCGIEAPFIIFGMGQPEKISALVKAVEEVRHNGNWAVSYSLDDYYPSDDAYYERPTEIELPIEENTRVRLYAIFVKPSVYATENMINTLLANVQKGYLSGMTEVLDAAKRLASSPRSG